MKILKPIKKHNISNVYQYGTLLTDLYPNLEEPKKYPCVLVVVEVNSSELGVISLKKWVYEDDFLPF